MSRRTYDTPTGFAGAALRLTFGSLKGAALKRCLEKQVNFKQADQFLIVLNEPIEQYERARRKVEIALEAHPGSRAFIIHRTDAGRLDIIEP